MSRIPELLRELADAWEEKENSDKINQITVDTKLNVLEESIVKADKKMKKVADAFATFAYILGEGID